MKLRKLLSALKSKLSSPELRIEKVIFHGHELELVKGTIRKKVDRDDHWVYLLTKPTQVFYDVGCNMGFVSLIAFLANENKRVVLIDANKKALQIAFRNMLLNGYAPKCTFYDGFISGESNKKTKFYTIGAGAAGSMFRSHAESASLINSFEFIQTRTLDQVVFESGLQPDLVKVDVEGAERFVLSGAVGLARLARTRFFVEMHSNQELSMATNARAVLDWCKSVSYQAWYLRDEIEVLIPEVIADRGRCHLLLQPEGWQYPEFLRGVKEGSDLPVTL